MLIWIHDAWLPLQNSTPWLPSFFLVRRWNFGPSHGSTVRCVMQIQLCWMKNPCRSKAQDLARHKIATKKMQRAHVFFGGVAVWTPCIEPFSSIFFLGERSKTFSELTDFMDCWTRSASLAEIFSKGRKGSTPVVAPGPLRSQIKMGKARNVCMSYCKMDLILIQIKLWKVTRNAKWKNNSIKSNDITLTNDWILLLCKWKRNNWIKNVDLSKQNDYVRVCDTCPIRINSLWFTTLKTRALDYKKIWKKTWKLPKY